MSTWRDERNAVALARLAKALPPIYPQPILIHARRRPLVPPLPRLAMESYWRQHPVRADRLARALAARSGQPETWAWTLSGATDDGRPRSFRTPPAPYREKAHARGPGSCCVCGQPVYRFGWHEDLWGDGKPNRRASWHACCVAAWKFWIAPTAQTALLSKLQGRKCPETGRRLLRTAEVDHRVPLFRVWREHRDLSWVRLLVFWGVPNLQAINRPAHVAKSALEAGERAGLRSRGEAGATPESPGRNPELVEG